MEVASVEGEVGNATGQRATGHRISQLDGLRGLAIFAVWFHHYFFVRLMWMGVDLFFVLSGFLITGVLMARRNVSLRRYFISFYERRAKRIYPPYLLVLLVVSLLFGSFWLGHAYLYLFLMNFVIPMDIAQPRAFAVLWSLAVEEQFYLVWPFAVYFLSPKRLKWLAVGLVVLAPLLRGLCTPLFDTHWWIYNLTPFRMDCLAMGALLAILWQTHRTAIQRFGHYGLILTAVALVSLGLVSRIPGFTTFANTRATNVTIYELSLLTATGLMLWALSGRGVAILNFPPLRYLGRISYSVYLIHVAALLTAEAFIASTALYRLAATAATLAYAMLSWHFLEQPLLGTRPAEPSAIQP
jgi:peptidoglycan/LPS O-acetylase OafA/YrhL